MENKITDDLNNLNKDSVKILTDIFKKDEPTYVMKDENYTFYLYLQGKTYNLEKDKILDKFKECDYSFSKLNNSLNGEYCIIILKYDDSGSPVSKLRHIYISVDYSGVNSVYYFLKKNNVYVLTK